MNIPHEFRYAAQLFLNKHLPFLDERWRTGFIDVLATMLHGVVKEHTSTTSNTALREAAAAIVELSNHAITHLPPGARVCRCQELDDGEHRAQPVCHLCALNDIRHKATTALKVE